MNCASRQHLRVVNRLTNRRHRPFGAATAIVSKITSDSISTDVVLMSGVNAKADTECSKQPAFIVVVVYNGEPYCLQPLPSFGLCLVVAIAY